MEANKYQKAVCKLRELVKGELKWKQEHTEAFEELKNMLSSDTVQAYFDSQAEHELHVDWQQLSRRGSPENKFGKLCSTPVEASQTQRKGIARSSQKP